MARKREIINVKERRKRLRAKVREMEAFGWVLDDYEDAPGRMVNMRFWRPSERPNRDSIKRLELAFSRISREESVFSVKIYIAGIFCLIVASIVGLISRDVYYTFLALLICFTISAAFLGGNENRIKRKRDVIIREARSLTEDRRPVKPELEAGGPEGEAEQE
jgi:hypothetical protein